MVNVSLSARLLLHLIIHLNGIINNIIFINEHCPDLASSSLGISHLESHIVCIDNVSNTYRLYHLEVSYISHGGRGIKSVVVYHDMRGIQQIGIHTTPISNLEINPNNYLPSSHEASHQSIGIIASPYSEGQSLLA